MKKFFSVLYISIIVLIGSGCSSHDSRIIGIKIYEYDKDFKELVDRWVEMGINTAFISQELAENKIFRGILKENNIRVYIIFPVFYDPDMLKQDSTLYAVTNTGRIAKDDWVEFVCPSRTDYRDRKIEEAARLVSDLNPDGLSIDFIREFVFWEKIYPDRTPESIETACFCDTCLNRFKATRGISIPDSCISTKQKADLILRKYPEAWNDYRCNLITTMVKQLGEKVRSINPEIKINVHAVPWRDDDFGGANIKVAAQDLNRIAPYCDYISPMCYSQMLKRDAGWIASVVNEMDKKAVGKILPSIQVYPYYIDDPFTVKDFRNCLESALQAPSLGVVFFSWPLFEKDTARMKVVIEIIKNRH
ncbi:MAG: hypothetical protein Q8868_14220 [Bacteroidota bacterium]|nr:hypothetical protein [Bacteroidota bacterium]